MTLLFLRRKIEGRNDGESNPEAYLTRKEFSVGREMCARFCAYAYLLTDSCIKHLKHALLLRTSVISMDLASPLPCSHESAADLYPESVESGPHPLIPSRSVLILSSILPRSSKDSSVYVL